MVLRAIGLTLHKVIALSAAASKLYLAVISKVFRSLPNGRFKSRMLDSLASVQWPSIDLPPQDVCIEGVNFRLVPHFREFDFESLLAREITYERCVFSFLKKAKRYDTIIEIGANVGIYTFFLSRLYDDGQIYVFEPSRTAYLRLLKNVELNESLKNIHTFNAAIGDRAGLVSFYEPQGHLTNGSFNKDFASIFSRDVRENTVLMVDGIFLKDLFEKSRSVLLKIDAEGAEALILKNLKPILQKFKPDILVEALEMFQDEMNSLGLSETYDFYELTEIGPVLRSSFQPSANRDYILIART